jgi:hypothetical protein
MLGSKGALNVEVSRGAYPAAKALSPTEFNLPDPFDEWNEIATRQVAEMESMVDDARHGRNVSSPTHKENHGRYTVSRH